MKILKNKGFTLIELVVVIVILGILAVTAAPKFLNLQSDAKQAALEGMKGSLEGALGITYGKFAIAGLENEASVNGYKEGGKYKADIIAMLPDCGSDPGDLTTFCEFDYGYPKANFATLSNLVTGLSAIPGEEDWLLYGVGVVGAENEVKITASSTDSSRCYISYRRSIDLDAEDPAPTIEIVDCD
nr:type II secretion system protein [Vibrio genomosp. F6]